MTLTRLITAITMVLAIAPMSSCFSLTALLNRRARPKQVPVPSKALQEFNEQMAAIVAEERRDHYYPYMRQTAAFVPLVEESTSSSERTLGSSK